MQQDGNFAPKYDRTASFESIRSFVILVHSKPTSDILLLNNITTASNKRDEYLYRGCAESANHLPRPARRAGISSRQALWPAIGSQKQQTKADDLGRRCKGPIRVCFPCELLYISIAVIRPFHVRRDISNTLPKWTVMKVPFSGAPFEQR